METWGLKLEQSCYQYFSDRTAGFIFSTDEIGESGKPKAENRSHALTALMKQACKMAVRSYYRVPRSFAATYPKEDWVQFAMIKLLECCDNYDHHHPFDHYVRFTLSRRLIDRQRKILGENPLVKDDLYRKYRILKRRKGSEPTVAELAEISGKSRREIRTFLEEGFGVRMFTCQDGTDNREAEARAGVTPEKQVIDEEARRILWECIDRLDPKLKMVFVRHEMEGLSFKKIYEQIPGMGKSLATFKRWYLSDVFDSVKDCVETHYA